MKYRMVTMVVFAVLVFSLSGCVFTKEDEEVEEVLQLENDILDDPLNKELDILEQTLIQEEDLTAQESIDSTKDNEQSDVESVIDDSEKTKVTPEPAGVSNVATDDASSKPSDGNGVAKQELSEQRKLPLTGKIGKVMAEGFTLKVIKLKTLTADEIAKIRRGEAVRRLEMTDEAIKIPYAESVVVERAQKGIVTSLTVADLKQGDIVIVNLNKNGAVVRIRIVSAT